MTRLPRQLADLARMLTYMLCHRPDEFGLVLSADGFIAVKQVLQTLTGEPGWGFVRRHHLDQVAALMQPPAFELAHDQIRCLAPGPARLRRPDATPPALLYAAIPPKAHGRVWEEGLKPPPEKELVLAATRETAMKLGRRRASEPVIVTVQAQSALRAGIAFQGYGDELFLAPALPREFLQLPPPQPKDQARPEKPPRPLPSPGSVMLDLSNLLQPNPKIRGKGKKGEAAWKSGARELRKKRGKGEKVKRSKGE
ncbi:MAG: RNA 2'-phosphotransferase [Pseudomonadota bacterium]